MSNPTSSARGGHQVPAGRDPYGRASTEHDQRRRILDAVADVASLVGYAAMTVDEICVGAELSRRMFYDVFADTHDAFLAALEDVASDLDHVLDAAHAKGDSFPTAVRAMLEALLAFLTAAPHRAELLLVESLAAGPDAIRRRRASLVGLAERLQRAGDRLPARQELPAITAEAAIGGVFEVIYSRLVSGEIAALPELAPDLAYSIMQPYLGREAAQAEAAKLDTIGR